MINNKIIIINNQQYIEQFTPKRHCIFLTYSDIYTYIHERIIQNTTKPVIWLHIPVSAAPNCKFRELQFERFQFQPCSSFTKLRTKTSVHQKKFTFANMFPHMNL